MTKRPPFHPRFLGEPRPASSFSSLASPLLSLQFIAMLSCSKKFALLGVALCLGAVTVGVVELSGGQPRLDSTTQWKNKVIAELAQQTGDTALILNEIRVMKIMPSIGSVSRRWISEDLVVMRNGEWLAYRNLYVKEHGRSHDLFIGRGCDGRWYLLDLPLRHRHGRFERYDGAAKEPDQVPRRLLSPGV
jgi:hypothetical protein